MKEVKSKIQKRVHSERVDHADSLLQRLRYVCTLYYGGRPNAMARALGVRGHSLIAALNHGRVPQLSFFLSIARAGLVNAEWLLCGTGPIFKEKPEALAEIDVPKLLRPAHAAFDCANVQYSASKPATHRVAKPPENVSFSAALPLARALHALRVAHGPVLLYLDAHAVRDGAGVAAVEFLHKGYVTAVATSTAAAQADLAQAIFGGNLIDGFVPDLAELQRAAYLAAGHGLGYGEALGRWGYPTNSRRSKSFIAAAYELNLPITIHAALGEAEYHFFPTTGGAEFGAALGAASYADMCIFVEQIRHCVGPSGGMFIAVERETAGALLLQNAQAALATRNNAPDVSIARARLAPQPNPEQNDDYFISGEPRLTLSALLTACDAVYDGSADDARRSRRTRNYRVKRN